METVVELFTGFLDSGKTTLINEALHSPDFLDYNQTLLIVCEEGDEEYDEAWLKKNGIIKYVVDEEEKLNEFFLEGLELNYRPDHVMIEFNGTWDLNRMLEMKLPPGDWSSTLYCGCRHGRDVSFEYEKYVSGSASLF